MARETLTEKMKFEQRPVIDETVVTGNILGTAHQTEGIAKTLAAHTLLAGLKGARKPSILEQRRGRGEQ